MIDLNFGLWWSGSKLSYLRYLTLKSLRHFHPRSRIQLYVGKTFKKDRKWVHGEQQDFDSNKIKKDYLCELDKIGVEVLRVDMFSQYPPNYQSDFFRWWWLQNNGGFYLDTDQIILKSFAELPLDNKIIYCKYDVISCGVYTPVGVIGAERDSKIVNYIVKNIPGYYDPRTYNSLGPYMFRHVLKVKKWNEGVNVPSLLFYPIPESGFVVNLYNGSFKIPKGSLGLHWYGGHSASQQFNQKYTEDFSKISNDTISMFLREKKII